MSDIAQHIAVSQRVDINDLDWDLCRRVGITEREVENLKFFADIETNQLDAAVLPAIRLLARAANGVSVSTISTAGDATQIDSMLDQLGRREMIEHNAQVVRFQVELIRRWFARDD